MLYEVQATLYLVEEDEGRDFLHDCLVALPKATVIHPGQSNQQCSIAELIDNHHDEDPNAPCIVIEHHDNCPSPPY